MEKMTDWFAGHALVWLMGIAGTLSLCIAVSGASQITSTPIWEEQGRFVRIVPQDSSDAPPNDHPATLSVGQLRAMLNSLEVKAAGAKRFGRKVTEDWQTSVFADKEIEILAKAISIGLKRASSGEDIQFFITGDHDVGVRGIFKNRDLNTGRVFVAEGKLNIIFGEVHAEYSKSKAKDSASGLGGGVPDMGSRKRASEHSWGVVAQPGITHHAQGGEPRTDWAVIDPDIVLDRAGWQPGRRDEEGFVQEPDQVEHQDPRIEKDRQAVVITPETESSTTKKASGAHPLQQPLVGTPSKNTELEQRLQTLKELRDKGLISEELYNSRVEKTLDSYLQ